MHISNGTTIYSRSAVMAAADRQRSGNGALQSSPVEPLRNRRLWLATNSIANQYKREKSWFLSLFSIPAEASRPLGEWFLSSESIGISIIWMYPTLEGEVRVGKSRNFS